MPDDLRDQFPKVREVVKALRIPVYEMQGYEADDVIGTITQQLDPREDLETTIVTVDLDMLQLVTPRVRLMTTRSGRREHGHVRRRADRRAVRAAARPDDRLQGAQGRPDRQHPGRARGRREDGGQAHPRLRRPRRAVRAARRGHAREARATSSASTVDQIRMGRELSTIVRDLPIEIDLEAARLGDYDRDTVVRLFREYEFRTLIERLPPMAGESAEQRTESAPRGRRERLRAGGARRRPARGLGRRPGHRPAGRAASSSCASTSTRSAAATAAGRRAARRPRDGAARAGTFEPADDLPTRPRRGDRRPGPDRGPRRGPDRRPRAVARGAAAVGASLRRRRPAPAPRHAARAGGRRRRTAGSSPRTAPRRRTRCAASLERDRHPARRPRGQAAPRRALRRRPGGAAARRSRSTPRSRPTSSTPRCAARRSPTSSPRTSTRSCRRPTELPATARAGLEALSALAVREPLERRLERGRARPPVPRDRAAAHPGPRPDGGGRRRPRSRGARPSSTASSAAEITRLEQEIYVDVGHEFNLGSPKQLEQILFFELNLPKGKRTKTGYSTDASVLEDLRPAHPMIDKLLEWRVYTKLRSTYVEALPTLIADRRPAPHDVPPGRRRDRPPVVVRPEPPEHPDPDGARAADPAGVRGRRAGRSSLLAADYSQIELRILAHVSGDEHLKDAFARRRRHPPRDRRPGPPQGPGRRSPTASGRWPRWSTSGWPTG